MKHQYFKYQAEICVKQKHIKIYKQILQGNNIRFLKQLSKTEIDRIPITIDIPLEEYEESKQRFDSSAFQLDDRFFTTTQIKTRPSVAVCKSLMEKALESYNTEPYLLINQL